MRPIRQMPQRGQTLTDRDRIIWNIESTEELLEEWRAGGTEPGYDILRDHLPELLADLRALLADPQ